MTITREEFEKGMGIIDDVLRKHKDTAFTIGELARETSIESGEVADYVSELQEEGKVEMKLIGRTQYVIWAGDEDE